MSDILITGGAGQVGRALLRLTWPAGTALAAPPRAELDLADPAALSAWVLARRFALIINCAAYTAVDKCESDACAAWTANALAPAALAQAGAAADIPIIHISTDYVFDGRKAEPYVETDAVSPLSVYGASKAGGELAVRTANRRHIILRTSWVFGAAGSNFVKTMLRLGAERPSLRVIDDQFGTPTSADDLAQAIAVIARRLILDTDAPAGTYHFTNAGETTWCGFAAEIFEQSARRGGPSARVEPIPAAQYPLPARRPANSRLATRAIARDFGVNPRPWRAALSDIMDELLPRAR